MPLPLLHRHPALEFLLKETPHAHVVVDQDDWEFVMKVLNEHGELFKKERLANPWKGVNDAQSS